MAVEGSLDLFQLPEILQIIAQEKKTGILTVQGESDIVAISFLDGRVVAADALNQTLEDGLGEVLVEQDQISIEALEAAVLEQRRSGGRLIDILVDGGGLERAGMLGALRQLTYRLLEGLLGWQNGEFKFYSGDEVSYEPGFVPISVQDLLLRTLADVKPEPRPPAAEPRASEAPPPPQPSPAPPLAEIPLRPVEAAAPVEEISVKRPSPPPAPAVEEVVERPVRERVRRRELMPRIHLPGILAVLALVALGGVVLRRPTDLVLPLPPQGEIRAAFEQSRWHARYSELDAAVKTYCLLEGRLPTDLRQLVVLGLVTPSGVRGPEGRQLSLVEEGYSYQVRDQADEGGVPGAAGFTGSIRGDFLLDTDFLRVPDGHQTPPLVLLD